MENSKTYSHLILVQHTHTTDMHIKYVLLYIKNKFHSFCILLATTKHCVHIYFLIEQQCEIAYFPSALIRAPHNSISRFHSSLHAIRVVSCCCFCVFCEAKEERIQGMHNEHTFSLFILPFFSAVFSFFLFVSALHISSGHTAFQKRHK